MTLPVTSTVLALPVGLDAGVPAERGHERHARAGLRRADRVACPPAPRPHDEQVGHRRRRRVRAQRGQILIGERVADEGIVSALVAAPAEGAERRRDSADLDVEGAVDPRAAPGRRRRRAGPCPRSSDRTSPTTAMRLTGRQAADSASAEHPQRVVLVVGVVEIRARRRLPRTWRRPRRRPPAGRRRRSPGRPAAAAPGRASGRRRHAASAAVIGDNDMRGTEGPVTLLGYTRGHTRRERQL